MPKASPIPYRNRSPNGWWLACCLERFEYYDEDRRDLKRRCLAWENTILIKAADREEAYLKALEVGGHSEGTEAWDSRTGRRGCWHFEGLTSLLAIHDDLEDGAELIWVEHAGRQVRTIKSFVKPKRGLEVFDDTPPDDVPQEPPTAAARPARKRPTRGRQSRR